MAAVVHGVAERLRGRLLHGEEGGDDLGSAAEDAYEPRREAVDGRPQHHGYHHAGYAPAVEVACALAHWQQQQARHHGEERYARTHEGAYDRAPPAAVGGGDVGRDVVYVDAVRRYDHQQGL